MKDRINNLKFTATRWEEEVTTCGNKTELTELDVYTLKALITKAEEYIKNAEECLALCDERIEEA